MPGRSKRYGAVCMLDVSYFDDFYSFEPPQSVERRSFASFFFYFLLFIAPYRFIITATAEFTPISLFWWVTIPGGVQLHSLSECTTICNSAQGPPNTTDFFHDYTRGFPATPQSAIENAAALAVIPSATDDKAILGGTRWVYPYGSELRWTVGPYANTKVYPTQTGVYSNWDSNEPSGTNWGSGCTKENHIAMYSHNPNAYGNPGKWNDECSFNLLTTGCLCQGFLAPTASKTSSVSDTEDWSASMSSAESSSESMTASKIAATTSVSPLESVSQSMSASPSVKVSVSLSNSISLSQKLSQSESYSMSQQLSQSGLSDSMTRTTTSTLSFAPESGSFTISITHSKTNTTAASNSMQMSLSESPTMNLSSSSSPSVTDTKTLSITGNSDTIACSPPMIQLNPSIGSIANNDAVLESAITISANHTVVTVHRAALVNKRCLVLEVHQMHPVSHGGDALDPSKVPIVTGPLAVEFSNISWSVFEASTDSMNGALSRYGRVELCTTSFNANGKQHFQMLGVLSGSVQASLRIPLLCRQVLPSYSSMLDIVFVASDSSSSDTTPIQRAVTAPLSLNANSIARRGLPTLQRVGGGGCTADAADGLWELDMGKEQWALYGGSVLGNITIVIVLWAGFGLLAMIWWSCWNGKEFTTTDTPSQSPITIVALLIWTAFRSVHMASLWLPIFAVVIVPVTTNAVALTFMWINDTNTASWRLTGVFALLVGVWTLLVLLWVGQNAKRCLVVDRTIRRKLATNVQASWWELLTRRFKWRAPEDNKRSISFKLHAQLALDEATSWWYIPFDTLLAVAVAVTDGSGKALGGGNMAACWVSLCIGPLTQLLLLLVVVRWTPHGDLFTHWIAVLASLLCFAAGVMQLLLAMIQVDLFDVPSDVEKTMLVVLSALLLVAAGVSWMRYVANLVSVLVWIFGNMTGRSKYGAARNGAVVATSRTRTASAVVISRRTSSVALMISTPYEKETTFAAPRSAERTPLRKVPSMSFFVPPTTPTTSVPVLNDSGDEDDSFVHLPFSSPFEITVIRPPPQENVKDSDGNTNDDMVVAFPPFVINEKASSFSSSEDGSISVRRKRSDGKRNPLTSAYGHEEARNNKKETWMLL